MSPPPSGAGQASSGQRPPRGSGNRPSATSSESTPGGAEGRGTGGQAASGQGTTAPAPTAPATSASRAESESASPSESGEGTPEPQPAGGERRGGGQGGGRLRPAPAGSYRVVLLADGKEFSQELRLVTDPNLPALSDLLGTEAEYEVWQGDDEPFDRDLKNAIKQSQAWSRMFSDN